MKPHKALGNLLLSKLSGKERRRIDALLEKHEWSSGESLHDPGKRVAHVYFPVDGVASLVGQSAACNRKHARSSAARAGS